ncbi:MAG: hypothetical protein ACOX89_09930 [Lutispora sp.]|jgi:prefoldin subunit 5|uniref:hypothetical protein n=1 Tax=Lutispora sp. TaxID=2828727 RepID=UPI0035666245
MGKSSNRKDSRMPDDERYYSQSPSEDVDFYKRRIDELEDEIKMLKKLVKKREKYEELLREKEQLVNKRLKGRKR